QLIEINLFKIGLHYVSGLVGFMNIMLVRRIARPVACGCVDLYDNETMAWKARRYDAIDLSRGMIAAANLDLHITRRHEARLVILIGWGLSDGELASGFRAD